MSSCDEEPVCPTDFVGYSLLCILDIAVAVVKLYASKGGYVRRNLRPAVDEVFR